VIPAGLAAHPASASTAWPFGLSTACRIQYLYDAAETGLTAAVIRALEVRGQESAANAAKAGIQIQIEMSTTPTSSVAANTIFAANRGANHAIAYLRKPTSIAATTSGYVGGWSGPLVMDAPFLYLASQGNLLIEYDVASQPSTGWNIDCVYTAVAVHTPVGTGCSGLVSSATGGLLGQTLTWSLTGGPAGVPGALLLGTLELPVPIPVPGSAGCMLYQDIALALGTTLSSAGGASTMLPVPNSSWLRAQPVYGQFACLDATLSWILTAGARRTSLGGNFGVTRIYDTSSNTTVTGTVQQYCALVTRLHH
jgi:hypothetical protein